MSVVTIKSKRYNGVVEQPYYHRNDNKQFIYKYGKITDVSPVISLHIYDISKYQLKEIYEITKGEFKAKLFDGDTEGTYYLESIQSNWEGIKIDVKLKIRRKL